jgi:hypothetical protein
VPTYRACYRSGEPFAVGRSEQEANEIAQKAADILGESVWIFVDGSRDISREVRPETK